MSMTQFSDKLASLLDATSLHIEYFPENTEEYDVFGTMCSRTSPEQIIISFGTRVLAEVYPHTITVLSAEPTLSAFVALLAATEQFLSENMQRTHKFSSFVSNFGSISISEGLRNPEMMEIAVQAANFREEAVGLIGEKMTMKLLEHKCYVTVDIVISYLDR